VDKTSSQDEYNHLLRIRRAGDKALFDKMIYSIATDILTEKNKKQMKGETDE